MDFSLLDRGGGQGGWSLPACLPACRQPRLRALPRLEPGAALWQGQGRCRPRSMHLASSLPVHPGPPPTPPAPLALPPASGWDLAVKLLCLKNELNRGRLSASQALRHPFLLLPA